MNILMKFKSRITTEETYPHSIYLEYALEITDMDFFKQAYEFEKKMIKGHIVDETCECLGILQIRNIKSSEALELASQGIQTI